MQVTSSKNQTDYPRKEVLTDIPTSDLSLVISDFESEGAKVETIKQTDGNWTIEALFDTGLSKSS